MTHSGHGDADLEERVITCIAEGLEFAVATDHNHNTDYHSTMKKLGAGSPLTAVTRNEVPGPTGHLNAFPLGPAAPEWRIDLSCSMGWPRLVFEPLR